LSFLFKILFHSKRYDCGFFTKYVIIVAFQKRTRCYYMGGLVLLVFVLLNDRFCGYYIMYDINFVQTARRNMLPPSSLCLN